MEKGFYHPVLGYWQVTNFTRPARPRPYVDDEGNEIIPERAHHFTDDYPEGTIEVPVKPSENSRWDFVNAKWIVVPDSYTREQVAAEAERRIQNGTLINDIQFRCDDRSFRRLNALMRGFERGAIGSTGKTYETEGGVLFKFSSKEQIEQVLHAAEDFEVSLLERSAELQQLDLIPDPSQDTLWDLTKTLKEALAELM